MKKYRQKLISEQELKQDKLVTSVLKTIEIFEHHRRKVIMFLVAIIVVAVLFVSFSIYMRKMNEKAISDFYSIEKSLSEYFIGANQEKKLELIDRIEEYVKKYPRSTEATIAIYYNILVYYDLGRYDEAISIAEKQAKRRNLGHYGLYINEILASCYEQKGNYNKANIIYNKSVKRYNRSFLRSKAQNKLIRLSEMADSEKK